MPYKNPVLAVLTDFAITAQQVYETLRVQRHAALLLRFPLAVRFWQTSATGPVTGSDGVFFIGKEYPVPDFHTLA